MDGEFRETPFLETCSAYLTAGCICGRAVSEEIAFESARARIKHGKPQLELMLELYRKVLRERR